MYACGTVETDSFVQINGVLPIVYPGNANKASDYTCIVFIFVYALGYSMGFGPAAWVYGSEVCACSARSRLDKSSMRS